MSQCTRQGVLPFDPGHPYLNQQLIAYIGNKRRLQPLLNEVFSRLLAVLKRDGIRACGGRRAPVFLDPFAGSGSVSRLARYLGCRVLANDWEDYAYPLSFAHLCVGESEACGLFRQHGGPERILARLNALPAPPPGERYICRYYAPSDTERADYRTERLFYTRENALAIDAIRGRIEALYPVAIAAGTAAREATAYKEKNLLLASLLYQCATHTNTSGVFKACHKGFGGHGRDALKRIMSPIRLQMPVLIDSPADAEVGCEDAETFVRSRASDLCYLDPPYNQHQYGSNYHLLNTIARWDKPPVDNALRADGRLKYKAGIRGDWVRTRSEYCYRHSAAPAFRRLLEAIDARYIVLSYNTEGIIPFDELVELMSTQGRVELYANEYVKYRGGRQSISRQVHNLEFVLVLDRSSAGSDADRARLQRAVQANRLAVLMKRSFRPEQIRRAFSLPPGTRDSLPLIGNGRSIELPMPHLYRFAPEAAGIAQTYAGEANGDLQPLIQKLGACELTDRREEIRVLIEILERGIREARARQQGGAGRMSHDAEALQKRILWLLRKFAHRKYRESFEQTLAELRVLARGNSQRYDQLNRGLEEVASLARARFEG